MEANELLNKALDIAVDAHRHQRDKMDAYHLRHIFKTASQGSDDPIH